MIQKYNVTGMTCAACSARVEKVSSRVPGVEKTEVNLLAGTMVVTSREDVSEEIIRAVQSAGYNAALSGKTVQKPREISDDLRDIRQRLAFSVLFLAVLMYFTMGHMLGMPMPGWYCGTENAVVAALLQFLLTLPVVYLNRAFYTRGLKALFHRSPNMDSLIAVGSLAALTYGIAALFQMAWAMGHNAPELVEYYSGNLYFESAAMILTLVTVGKFLETRAKRKTGDAVRLLMDLSPKIASVRRGESLQEIPVEQVQVGDVVIIRSGERIPVDGTVLKGNASVDQSAMTGESIPAEKRMGDTVSASAVVQEGYLEIRADRVGNDTALAQVIRIVEEAGGSKAPIARLADRIAGVFVPAVMAISVVTFFGWMLAGFSLEFCLTNAISVLVISCPCALGLATPVAIMVGTGRGAQMGILFKNAEALENLHRIDTVVLDKTGTLTVGQPAVTDVIPGNVGKRELVRIAASLECRSEHPFARAILRSAGNAVYPEPEEFKPLPGKGVTAMIDGVRYYGGNDRLMMELGITLPDLSQLSEQGKTPLHFASEHKGYLGSIAAADVLKGDSRSAVKSLLEQHLDVVMLTGDNCRTAKAIASSSGISHVISDVLPTQKAEAIRKLQAEGRRVLMVGDGINDAPALVTADVGMAVAAGTDIAMDSADVVLMNNSLSAVSAAVALSRATIRNIRQNLFWAFFYNSLGIPIAAGLLYLPIGLRLSPMLGAAAMSMSSVFVVTNALRLRSFRWDKGTQDAVDIRKPEEIINKEETTMETVIKVEGMMCNHCKARVEKVCKAVPGTVDAVVDLAAKTVTVSGSADVAALKQAITEADYTVVE